MTVVELLLLCQVGPESSSASSTQQQVGLLLLGWASLALPLLEIQLVFVRLGVLSMLDGLFSFQDFG